MKTMNQKEMKEWLESLMPKAVVEIVNIYSENSSIKCKSVYLGSYMSLDPCGKYHHMLSPNNITDMCEDFWSNIIKIAQELNGDIVFGESDSTDVYFQYNFEEIIENETN